MTTFTNESRRGSPALPNDPSAQSGRPGAAPPNEPNTQCRRIGAAARAAVIDVSRRFTWVLATIALFAAMGGTWMTSATATAAPADSLVRRPATTTATATSGSGSGTSGVDPRRFDPDDNEPTHTKKRAVGGKLNLNTATEDQLMLLPQVGPAKAERIVTWRRKNGGFKRTADLRRVKGFGYKTFKRLEPLLDIRGETTLAPK